MRVIDTLDKYLETKRNRESTRKELEVLEGEAKTIVNDRFLKLDRELSFLKTELNNMVCRNPIAKDIMGFILRNL